MTSSPRLISGDKLPDTDHVLRYVRRKFVDNDQIDGNAFLSRSEEEKKKDGPSVNWMEFFAGDTASQIAKIRKVKRMKYEKRGRVAKLPVGRTKQYLQEAASLAIDCIYDPTPADKDGADEPSHAYMKGVPVLDTPEGEGVRDFLVHCIV